MTNALATRCPGCLAAPGDPCISTSTGKDRTEPHLLRVMRTARDLTPCTKCGKSGWVRVGSPDGDADRQVPVHLALRALTSGVVPCRSCGGSGWETHV